MGRAKLGPSLLLAAALAPTAGCYHYEFEQAPAAPDARTVTHTLHPATFLNGFVGEGTVDTRVYCEHPVRTELHVSAWDVLVGVATLLVYTPHTLEVTCPVPGQRSARAR